MWDLGCCAAWWPGGPWTPSALVYGEFSTSNAGSNETAPFRISVNAAIKYE
jgi:hypothetical protein